MTLDFVTNVSLVIAFVITAIVRFLLMPRLSWFRPHDMGFPAEVLALVIILLCFLGTLILTESFLKALI